MNVLVSDSTVPFAVSVANALGASGSSVSPFVPRGLCARFRNCPVVPVSWNRPSGFPARTAAVAVRNLASALDCAIIVFDADAFSLSGTDPDDLVGPIDQYVTGTLLLVGEIRAQVAKQGSGRLVFVHRESKLPDGDGGNPRMRNLSVAVAESAFVRLAEETSAAAFEGAYPGLQVSLVNADTTDLPAATEWFVSWLAAPPATRGTGRWIRSGSRGLFGMF
jgi:hypothetical protein